jgi:hypothetical protein
LETGFEASNYSKIERGLAAAPHDHAKLEPLREALGLLENSQEWRELLRLADLSRSAIPRTILSDPQVMAKMPALMRRLDGEVMTDQQIEDLVRLIRDAHEPDRGEDAVVA